MINCVSNILAGRGNLCPLTQSTDGTGSLVEKLLKTAMITVPLYSCSSTLTCQGQQELMGVWKGRDKLLRPFETMKNTAQARENTSLEEISEVWSDW